LQEQRKSKEEKNISQLQKIYKRDCMKRGEGERRKLSSSKFSYARKINFCCNDIGNNYLIFFLYCHVTITFVDGHT
jgi:hypothetical protein